MSTTTIIFREREREEREFDGGNWKGVSFNMARHQIINFDLIFHFGILGWC